MRRTLKILGVVVLVAVLFVITALFTVTKTDFGRERARRIALDLLRERVNGTVSIGRIEGNLLGSFSLVDVAITDSAGHPFLSADRLTASLATRSLLGQRIALSGVRLVRPVLHLERTPQAGWNYERVLRTSEGVRGDTLPGWGSWIALSDVSVTDGTVIVRQPWSADNTLGAAAADSAIAEALAGSARARVDAAPYGLRQTMDFRALNGHFADVVIADPDSTDIVVTVDSLSTMAAPFNPPAFDVRRLSGVVRVGADSMTVRNLALTLPGSRATGRLDYLLESGDVITVLDVDTLSLDDIRGAYLPLPNRGGGRMHVEAEVRSASPSRYDVTNARLQVGETRVVGDLRLLLDDSTTRFGETLLAFTRFPTSLLEQLAPGAVIPVAGIVDGRARVLGELRAMQVDVDGRFDAEQYAPFRFVLRGGAGVQDDGSVTANGLRVEGRGIPLAIARAFEAESTVGGSIDVQGTVSGSTASRLTGRLVVTHNEDGNVSRVSGEGVVGMVASQPSDVRLVLDSVSLQLATHAAPDMKFEGVVKGTARVRGTPRDLLARVDLILPGNGTVQGDVTYRQSASSVARYGASLEISAVDLHAVVPELPTTTLTGVVLADAEGTDLATLKGSGSATLRGVVVDSAEFREAALVVQAADGMLQVDTLRVRASFGAASASGTLGLVAGRAGVLRYKADVDDLEELRQWIATGDTGVVAARPAIGARLTRLAREADSLRQAQLVTTDPAALLAVDSAGPRVVVAPRVDVAPIPRDSLAGSVSVTGEVTGYLDDVTATAAIATPGVVWGGNLIGAGSVQATWTGLRTSSDVLVAEGGVHSLRAGGFEFDSTRFKVRHVRGEGDAEVAVFPGDSAEYSLGVQYALRTNEGEIRLRDVRLRFDSTLWEATRPSTISWRGRGIEIDSLELRNLAEGGGGRIFLNGEMPDADPGRLEIALDSVRVAPWLTLLQSNVRADGILSARAVVQGTRTAPRFEGTVDVVGPSYRGTPFPELHGRFGYDARVLTLDSHVRRAAGGELATIAGTLPIDLSFGDSVTTRFPDAPLAMVIEGDSIPLAPLADFVEGFTALEGRAYGRMALLGTWEQPQLDGAMAVDLSVLGLEATGVTMRDVVARAHTVGDTLMLDSLVTRRDGEIRATGKIVLASLSRPVLAVDLTARDARVLEDERGTLFADAAIRATGPLDSLTVGGRATITRGLVYIPDPEQFDVISTEDPAVFAVIDALTARELQLEQASEILDNLRLDVDVRVNRGTFARSPDANIEVYGDLNVVLSPETGGEFALTGSLLTDYGDYTFLGKRFVVSRGSVRFTGDTDFNPIVQVLANYEIRQAGRPPLQIRVVIGGTLERPQLTLDSDAQPKLSQSDLIAFLAFGRSSASLLQFTGTGVQGGGQGGASLVGNVAALARRQLTSIGLGALLDEAKSDIVGATGADVLNITPAELPAELSVDELQSLLRGTELEIGKYVDRNTFVLARIRPTLAVPGASVERRFGEHVTLRAILETRFLPRPASLSVGSAARTLAIQGLMLTWRFAW